MVVWVTFTFTSSSCTRQLVGWSGVTKTRHVVIEGATRGSELYDCSQGPTQLSGNNRRAVLWRLEWRNRSSSPNLPDAGSVTGRCHSLSVQSDSVRGDRSKVSAGPGAGWSCRQGQCWQVGSHDYGTLQVTQNNWLYIDLMKLSRLAIPSVLLLLLLWSWLYFCNIVNVLWLWYFSIYRNCAKHL